jgi:dipeptidyl-peptidase-4
MRKLFYAVLVTVAALGQQKKPVTLESLNEFRASERRSVPSDPIWAPNGKAFLYRQDGKLHLYDLASKQTREIADLRAIESAAQPAPEPERFDWENRRVGEAAIQWSSDGSEVLYEGGGDLFLIHVASGNWEQLTKTAEPERDPKLSPDGKRVAFRRGWDLYSLNLARRGEVRLTANGSETLRNGALDWVYPEELELETAYWWSPDSRSIAYLQFDTSGEPLYPHADLSGTRAVYEPQRYPQVGQNNPSVRLGIVAASGGETQWLEVGDTVHSYLIARAGWTADSGHVYAVRLNRVQNELEFLVYSTKAGAPAKTGASNNTGASTKVGSVSTVYRESDPYWINVSGEPRFLKNGRQFLWTSERDGFRHLYLYSLDGKAPKQLTRGAWEVTDISGVDENAGRVYYRSSESHPLERQLYSVALDGSGKRRITAGAGTHRVVMSPAANAFLDVYSNLTSPPEATLRKADGELIAVYRPADRRAIEQFNLLPTELIEFRSKSGVTLYGTLIKPAGFEAGKKYPAVVNVYGGPHAQSVRNAWRGLSIDQVFAHRGYLVWEMDNRGTAGRGHAFETPIFRNLGAVELADQREGVERLIAMGIADPARIGVRGWSYGGFMTLNMLLNAPDLFHAGFAGAPVTNWLNYDSIYTERYMGLPGENTAGYSASALPPKAGNLKGRLMIAHNLEDDNVLFQNTLQMIAALESSGKLFELAVYPQKTHSVRGADARQMDAAMLDFFERSLAAR